MEKKKSLKTPAIVVTIVCVLILGGITWAKAPDAGVGNAFLQTILYPLAEMLCSIAITAAIGTYLIEWKGFMDYVLQKQSELLSKPEMVKNLDADYQAQLLSQLMYERTGIVSTSFDPFMNEFYDELNKQRETFGYYLKEQSNVVKCSLYKEDGKAVTDPNSGVKFRKMTHTRTITYGMLKDGSVQLREVLAVNSTKVCFYADKPSVVVKWVKVNSKNRQFSVKCRDNNDTEHIDTLYKKRFVCTLNEPVVIKEDLKIEIRYETYEPMSDFSYCTRMKQFCKRFKMDFSYETDNFNVYAQVLAFGERKNQSISEDGVSVDIDNWLMPGEGMNIYIGGK